MADKISGLETKQALQLLNGILKWLLCAIKKHSTCYSIGTQGGVQPCTRGRIPALPTSAHSERGKTDQNTKIIQEETE